MYLDTHERDEMHKLVLSFHIRWFMYTLERIGILQTSRSLLLLVLYLAGLAMVVWLLPADKHGWAIFLLCAAFIGLLQLCYYFYRKQVRHRIDKNTPERWQQEIEQIDADSDERQLFLRLLVAMRGGTKEEVQSLLEEALRSPRLSNLTFLREVRAYTQ